MDATHERAAQKDRAASISATTAIRTQCRHRKSRRRDQEPVRKLRLDAETSGIQSDHRVRRYRFSFQILRYVEDASSAGDGPKELENPRHNSPSPGCGKTVTAINLAFSIARQPERSALLVDLDLQKPQVASTLGLNCESGVVSVLEGRTSLSSAIIRARVGESCIMVLPAETSTSSSSAWMASRAMEHMLQEIKRGLPVSYGHS